MNLSGLSNDEVLSSLNALLAEGDRIVAKEVAYLAEVEERRLHLELACPSMFAFCTTKLRFSEGEAFRRLAAARLVRRFPKILDAIATGRIHLSSVVLLRDLFDESNVHELIEAAAGKTKREVQALVARLAPKADALSSIRKLPERRTPVPASGDASTPPPATVPSHAHPPSHAAPQPRRPGAAPTSPATTKKPQLEILSAGSTPSEARYRVQLTASASLRDKLEHARALMSHSNPSGDLATVLERAVDLLIEKLEKEKLGTTNAPRSSRAPAKARHVPRSVRRKVVERDGLQCSFVSEEGERCGAREFLELDHRRPLALGGSSDETNVRVLCRAHNRLAAEQAFGRAHVEERIRLRQRKGPSTPRSRSIAPGASDGRGDHGDGDKASSREPAPRLGPRAIRRR